MIKTIIKTLLIALLAAFVLVSCREKETELIAIDGSSTVFPITEAVAEEFQGQYKAQVTIGISGSGGGFKKFCKSETVITNASRPIKPSEVELCEENGVEYIELPVAYDGIAVVAHKQADWIDYMTVEELRRLWSPEAQEEITRWNQIRPDWPDEEIHLFGAGVDSGTYDYFTQAIVGEEHSSRGDFTSSEDDNVLVQGIASDTQALGFFGLAYYVENMDKLKIIPIDDGNEDNGSEPIAPSLETVADGTYQPLSRPLFIYVNTEAAERKAVQDFISFYLAEGGPLVMEVGYIPLPDRDYELVKQRFDKRIVGSIFGGRGSQVGVTIEELLSGQ